MSEQKTQQKPILKINPLLDGYHFCLGCISGHNNRQNWRVSMLHLAVSILLITFAPSIFTIINGKSFDQIRSNSPYAQNSLNTNFEIGKVLAIVEENAINNEFNGTDSIQQKIKIETPSTQNQIDKIELNVYSDQADGKQKYNVGDELILRASLKKDGSNTFYYSVEDKFRVKNLVIIGVLFLILILALAGIRGISAVIGLMFTVIVIVQFLIPQILLGTDLFILTGIVSILIASTSLYLAHGFNKRTTISMISTVFTIMITLFIASWAVDFTLLSGFGSDDAFHLKGNGLTSALNLRGLLIAGIVIGSLGILDDVTTAQAVAIEEISKANPKMTTSELFFSGIRIGQEHIISLINTLALAYVGTSLPILLSFTTLNFSPIWVILNNQIIAEELIRTIVGSSCLILSIPISTLLAAKFLRYVEVMPKKKEFSFSENIDKIYRE